MLNDIVFNVEVVKTAGGPTDTLWSGNFEEKPAEVEKLEHRGHLFLVVSLKVSENPANLAHNFWIEFVTNFYTNLAGGVLSGLSESAKLAKDKVLPQISPLDFEFVAASIWGKILYLALSGSGAAGIVRGGKFSKILAGQGLAGEIVSASGFLQNEDLVFLGTAGFFDDLGQLESFSKSPQSQIEEELTARISQSQNPAKIAACVIKIREAEKTKPAEVVSFLAAAAEGEPRQGREEIGNKTKLSKNISRLFGQLKKAISQFWVISLHNVVQVVEKIASLRPRRDVYLQTGQDRLAKKRLFSLILVVLVVILFASLSFGIWQRQQRLNFAKFEEYFGKATSFYEQSVEISSINKLRARELLGEAQKNLTEAKKFKFEKKKVAELAAKIDEANSQSLKLVKVENPALIFDLALVKTSPTVSEIEKFENIQAFDKTSQTLFTIDLQSKTGQISAGGEQFAGFANFTVSGNFAYFLKPADGIYQLDLGTAELKKIINQTTQWGEILDLASFVGNLYLLDGAAGQVWKYTAGAGGFSEITGFLKQAGLNFSGSSFTIDGFIWVLESSGKLYQLTPTEAKLIEILGLDKPISAKTILRTTEEAENLYIADLGNSRILVVGKSGLYSAQYSSGVLGTISDFAVDEKGGKIYFVQGSKVFGFDLVK